MGSRPTASEAAVSHSPQESSDWDASIVYHVGKGKRTTNVPVADHHGGFVMPVLTPPSYLSGGEPLDRLGMVAFKAN